MNRRLVLAAVAVGLLATLAGCSMIFGGISDETLDEEADYEDLKDRNATAAIDLEAGGYVFGSAEFRAVYDLDDQEEVSMYRSSFYREQALDISAVRYWYPNGTVRTGSEIDVDQGRSSTDIVVPDGNGTLAMTGEASTRSLRLPATVEGSYNVSLPEGHRTSSILFGDVSPSGYERSIVDDREWLEWEEVDSTLSIRHFLPRDVYVFGGFVGVILVVGGAGAGYLYLLVKRLRKQRRDLGLDVDIDDDSDRRPPPGMG